MRENKRKEIELLIDKAGKEENAQAALWYSQAASNAASALRTLRDAEREDA